MIYILYLLIILSVIPVVNFEKSIASKNRIKPLPLLIITLLFLAVNQYVRGNDFELILYALLCAFLLQLSLFDFYRGWLPREFTMPFMIAGLFIAIINQHFFISLITAMIFSAIFMMALRRKKCGVGDIFFLIGLCLWLSIIELLFALVIGCFINAAIMVITHRRVIPFSPAICFSIVLMITIEHIVRSLFLWQILPPIIPIGVL